MATIAADVNMQKCENVNAFDLKRFKSFAVLDLETNDLPTAGFSRVAITEFSLYGFAATELEKSNLTAEYHSVQKVCNQTDDVAAIVPNLLQKRPRVLHKLTLMLNPRRIINPIAERVTGLSNYNLEFESYFDENAAKTVLGFLKHLQQPVCLVAHNGYNFDFRIIKQSFQKLNMSLPNEIICIDSLRAFQKIDEMRLLIEHTEETVIVDEIARATTPTPITTTLKTDTVDFQVINETTPKRPTTNSAEAKLKRKIMAESLVATEVTPIKAQILASNGKRTHDKMYDSIIDKTFGNVPKSRRCLFPSEHISASQSPSFKKYPPKGVYRLSLMFERIFGTKPANAHNAEADVDMLTRLLLHYGADFLEYVEKYAIPFSHIK